MRTQHYQLQWQNGHCESVITDGSIARYADDAGIIHVQEALPFMLTAGEAADLLGVGQTIFNYMQQRGELRSIGDKFSKDDVLTRRDTYQIERTAALYCLAARTLPDDPRN